MPEKPTAEVATDERLVRRLLAEHLPDLSGLHVRWAASGWDCDVWRIGDDLAMRMPRRAVAAPLIRHEQSVLPLIGPGIEATGLRVPLPLFVGQPSQDFPWPWSVVRWVDGSTGLGVARSDRRAWAPALAAALVALHRPAPAGYPRNPFRGVALAVRSEVVRERMRALGSAADTRRAVAEEAWARGTAAAPWTSAPVWIHGDLHPGNLVADGRRLAAIIDFGDVTAGDPAYDLATAWLTFDADGRADFMAHLAGRYDRADWERARAWAAAVAAMLLVQSDDDPIYHTLGTETLHELSMV